MTSLSALIAQVEALDEKASKAPWKWTRRLCRKCRLCHECGEFAVRRDEDGDLIAAYRSAAPVLAAALKDAVETLEKIGAKSWEKHDCGRHTIHEEGHVIDCGRLARSFLERHKETL